MSAGPAHTWTQHNELTIPDWRGRERARKSKQHGFLPNILMSTIDYGDEPYIGTPNSLVPEVGYY